MDTAQTAFNGELYNIQETNNYALGILKYFIGDSNPDASLYINYNNNPEVDVLSNALTVANDTFTGTNNTFAHPAYTNHTAYSNLVASNPPTVNAVIGLPEAAENIYNIQLCTILLM